MATVPSIDEAYNENYSFHFSVKYEHDDEYEKAKEVFRSYTGIDFIESEMICHIPPNPQKGCCDHGCIQCGTNGLLFYGVV